MEWLAIAKRLQLAPDVPFFGTRIESFWPKGHWKHHPFGLFRHESIPERCGKDIVLRGVSPFDEKKRELSGTDLQAAHRWPRQAWTHSGRPLIPYAAQWFLWAEEAEELFEDLESQRSTVLYALMQEPLKMSIAVWKSRACATACNSRRPPASAYALLTGDGALDGLELRMALFCKGGAEDLAQTARIVAREVLPTPRDRGKVGAEAPQAALMVLSVEAFGREGRDRQWGDRYGARVMPT